MQLVKKYTLSFLVIAAFVIYTLYYKTFGSNLLVKSAATTTTTSSLPIIKDPLRLFRDDEEDEQEEGGRVIAPAPVPTPVPTPTLVPTAPMMPSPMMGQYKDGSYTGERVYNYHGYIQVQAVISGGKISNVVSLEYPKGGDSGQINRYAMPRLTQEAIVAQSSKVNTISGATDTSGAFRQSLESALALARN